MSETHDDQGHRPAAGLPDADEVSADEKAELEQERQARLDPDRRPDGVEVDNTDRDFDPATGLFTDDPDHTGAEPVYSASDEA